MYKILGITPNILFMLGYNYMCQYKPFIKLYFTINTMSLKHRIGKNLAVMCFEGIVKSNSTYLDPLNQERLQNVIDHQSQINSKYNKIILYSISNFYYFISYLPFMIITAPYASILSILYIINNIEC